VLVSAGCVPSHLICSALARASPAVQVTLIDQSERFVFKPLLYELLNGAASDDEVAPPFAQLLAPYPVAFVQGRVAAVQPEHIMKVGGGGWGGQGRGRGAGCVCSSVCLGVHACEPGQRATEGPSSARFVPGLVACSC